MPRPAISASERRDEHLRVRVSVEEAGLMDERARNAGLAFSDYARHVLVGGKTVTRLRERLPFDLRRELERIAINLRQLRDIEGPAPLSARVGRVHTRLATRLREELDAFLSEAGLLPSPGGTLAVVRTVRLSADQREVIEALAARAGKERSAYAREMLSTGRVTVIRDREIASGGLEALKALGLKLNERTHLANIHKRLPDGLPSLLCRLEAQLDLIPGL
jgi:predicted DNA-binding protein